MICPGASASGPPSIAGDIEQLGRSGEAAGVLDTALRRAAAGREAVCRIAVVELGVGDDMGERVHVRTDMARHDEHVLVGPDAFADLEERGHSTDVGHARQRVSLGCRDDRVRREPLPA